MPREGIIFAYGNPLLDIQSDVDDDFLKKYGLEPNNAILADDKHKNMYDELTEKYNVEYIPGGATQNSIRIAQWLIGIPKATTFVGCVSKDKYGTILEKITRDAGVNVHYQYDGTEPTGTCAVLLSGGGTNRSLVAYLAAANKFTIDHLQTEACQALIQKAEYFYISGFPLTVCPEGMLSLAKHASENDKVFSMNLSAPFLCSVFKEQMLKLLPYVDILFGNESEAEEFSKANNLGLTDMKEIALKLAQYPKQNGKKGRMVVFTHGAKPTIVVREGEVIEYPVIHIEPKDIVDTNGAGDAFVGGFLSHLVQGATMEECIRCANYAANLIIQRSGCTLPDRPNFSHGPASM